MVKILEYEKSMIIIFCLKMIINKQNIKIKKQLK